ncbi:MAG: DNA mismatch repair protein MutS [Candidatus Heimdallarchaeota archaeon]|nr:DNA mismatch repair protein MutS [Candidatus Heimdallarchaeota archaeon]MCK4953797.1 DNA mismatch repair protein MutS [Candidatus Heimdallarchaeota archaeon]
MKQFDDRKLRPKLTPMMQQWQDIKKQYTDYILFFRAGDFYECFNEDAKIASKVLNITLTARTLGEKKFPLAGVPYHAVDAYIAKMVEGGYRVAVVEQLEDPKVAKKIVKRGVVQLVTRGTITLPESLTKGRNNYLSSIYKEGEMLGFAALDLSTGEFLVTDFEGDAAQNLLEVELSRLNTSEIIVQEELWSKLGFYHDQQKCTITYREDYFFNIEQGQQDLCRLLNVLSLDGYGVNEYNPSIGAAGAILRYIKETQMRENFPNITKISQIKSQDFMILDFNTIRNLELIENLRDRTEYGTLRQVLDNTKTPGGSRLLTSWILRPSFDYTVIQNRIDATEEMLDDTIARDELRNILSRMSDIERLTSRICLGRSKPRDLIALRNSLELIPDVKTNLLKFKTLLLKEIENNLDPLKEVVNIICTGIQDEVPVNIKDGNVIRDGYNADLDELRNIQRSGKSFLTSLEAREKVKTGIKTLKVRFNKVFGYYIEIPKASSEDVPSDYERKQTLVNAERFVTPELKEYEEKILNAEEKILVLEEELFNKIMKEIAQFATNIQQDAYYCSVADVIATFVQNASFYHYSKPEISEENIIEIKDGRHPVVEKLLTQTSFIPNDIIIKKDSERILIITGPNMGGKSTLLRQVALIVLMAQIGSFVPASSAKIGLTDRIFTRIGAHDVIVENRSSFLVEMYECANILNNATEQSLVILDEVGRGTSTYDGVALAWSIIEYLHDHIGQISPTTLFATHYHKLIDLEKLLPNVKNYHASVKNVNGDIHFLYKLKEGGISESFGIHVASLAGLPEDVIDKANDMLSLLQKEDLENGIRHISQENESQMKAPVKSQKTAKKTVVDELISNINEVKLDEITPIEALNILSDLVKKSKKILKDK